MGAGRACRSPSPTVPSIAITARGPPARGTRRLLQRERDVLEDVMWARSRSSERPSPSRAAPAARKRGRSRWRRAAAPDLDLAAIGGSSPRRGAGWCLAAAARPSKVRNSPALASSSSRITAILPNVLTTGPPNRPLWMVRNPTTSRWPRQAQNPWRPRRSPLRLGRWTGKSLPGCWSGAWPSGDRPSRCSNRLVDPLPPRRITISTGPRRTASYYMFAKEYAKLHAADGFSVDITTGAGTVETLKAPGRGPAMAGFVPGRAAEQRRPRAALAREPLTTSPSGSSTGGPGRCAGSMELRGLSIQVGEEGSGIRPLAMRLAAATRVTSQNRPLMALTRRVRRPRWRPDESTPPFFIMAPTVRWCAAPAEPDREPLECAAHDRLHDPLSFLSTVTSAKGAVDLVATCRTGTSCCSRRPHARGAGGRPSRDRAAPDQDRPRSSTAAGPVRGAERLSLGHARRAAAARGRAALPPEGAAVPGALSPLLDRGHGRTVGAPAPAGRRDPPAADPHPALAL